MIDGTGDSGRLQQLRRFLENMIKVKQTLQSVHMLHRQQLGHLDGP